MILRGLRASIRCHEQFGLTCFGTINQFAVDPIHVDGFASHAIRRDSALAPHKNLNAVWPSFLLAVVQAVTVWGMTVSRQGLLSRSMAYIARTSA